MVTSRSVPQQTAQIFSPLAGQKRAALRFSQMGQDTESPQNVWIVQQNTRCGNKRQNRQANEVVELDVNQPFPRTGRLVRLANLFVKCRGPLLRNRLMVFGRTVSQACLSPWTRAFH